MIHLCVDCIFALLNLSMLIVFYVIYIDNRTAATNNIDLIAEMLYFLDQCKAEKRERNAKIKKTCIF